jgi:hypothetical protein
VRREEGDGGGVCPELGCVYWQQAAEEFTQLVFFEADVDQVYCACAQRLDDGVPGRRCHRRRATTRDNQVRK